MNSENRRPKVFITNPGAPQEILDSLRAICDLFVTPDVFDLSGLAESDAVFVFRGIPYRIDDDFLNKAGPNLKVISATTSGYEHIDVKACRKKGIALGYSPDGPTEATAELTVALLLCAARRLFEASETLRRGSPGYRNPTFMCGKGVHNSTVGIVGLGRIAERELGLECTSLPELLTNSDYIVLTCPLTEETTNLIDSSAFKLMKKDAIVVNTSRGGVIDQEALYHALENGQIGGAALDVSVPDPLPPDHKLLKLPNLIAVPHIGGQTHQALIEMSKTNVDNILAALANQPMPYPIPF